MPDTVRTIVLTLLVCLGIVLTLVVADTIRERRRRQARREAMRRHPSGKGWDRPTTRPTPIADLLGGNRTSVRASKRPPTTTDPEPYTPPVVVADPDERTDPPGDTWRASPRRHEEHVHVSFPDGYATPNPAPVDPDVRDRKS